MNIAQLETFLDENAKWRFNILIVGGCPPFSIAKNHYYIISGTDPINLFRVPHYSVSPLALVEEANLARFGLLLMDETEEFSKDKIELLFSEKRNCVIMGITHSCTCSCQGFGSCICSGKQIKSHQEWLGWISPFFDVVIQLSD